MWGWQLPWAVPGREDSGEALATLLRKPCTIFPVAPAAPATPAGTPQISVQGHGGRQGRGQGAVKLVGRWQGGELGLQGAKQRGSRHTVGPLCATAADVFIRRHAAWETRGADGDLVRVGSDLCAVFAKHCRALCFTRADTVAERP